MRIIMPSTSLMTSNPPTSKLAWCLIALFILQAINAIYQPVAAKTKTSHRIKHGASPFNVPPPPIYFPSLAEETEFFQGDQKIVPKKNPYVKYLHYPDGHSDPAPLQPNKYVTYWNKT